MIIPVKCFTCGKLLADKWEYYKEACDKATQKGGAPKKKDGDEQVSKYFAEPFKKQILDDLGLDRYCCRRHMLAHVDIIDNL